MRCAAIALALSLAAASPAVADAVLHVDVKGGGSVWRQTVYLAATGFRLETGTSVTIFRPDQAILYDMNPARQRYTKVTADRLRQAASDFDASRRNIAEQLAAMPDDRRHRMEAAFGPATSNSKSPLAFTVTGLNGTVGDWHCRILHVMLDAVQHGTVCVLPLSDLGLDAADAQVLRKLADLMLQGPRPAVGLASFWDLAAIEAAVGHPAFPVETIIAVPSGWMEYTVRSVERHPAAADAFDLPAGMTEEALPPHPGN